MGRRGEQAEEETMRERRRGEEGGHIHTLTKGFLRGSGSGGREGCGGRVRCGGRVTTIRDRASKRLRASAWLCVETRRYHHHGRKTDGKASSRYVQVL